MVALFSCNGIIDDDLKPHLEIALSLGSVLPGFSGSLYNFTIPFTICGVLLVIVW